MTTDERLAEIEARRISDERRYSKLHREFRKYTDCIAAAIRAVDRSSKLVDKAARGPALAKIVNDLEVANDSVRRFVLKLDWNGKPLKREKKSSEPTPERTDPR